MDNQTMDSNNDWRNPEEPVAESGENWQEPEEPAVDDNNNWQNPEAPVENNDEDWQNSDDPIAPADDDRPKKIHLLTRYSYILSIITAIFCSLPAVAVILAYIAWGPVSGLWILAGFIVALVEAMYAPFVIPIAISAILSIVFYSRDIKKIPESSDPSRYKIIKRTFVSAALLLVPAVVFPAASMIFPFDTMSPDFSYVFLEFGGAAILIINIAIFIALRVPRVKEMIYDFGASLRGLAILAFAIELVLCGGWGFSVARHFFEINREESMEREEREQSLKSLRNPAIDDELSDLVAFQTNQKPYSIVYSDSRTEGIFEEDLGSGSKILYYAAYYGKDGDGKKEVSVIELGRIYDATKYRNNDFAESTIIRETKYDYMISFIDASDDATALARAQEYVDGISRNISLQERVYVFYADGFSGKPTTKDYLNAILSSNIYIRDDSVSNCNIKGWYEQKYKCVETSGDLFQRYLNDESNFSSYSTEALYNNRHIYFAPTKENHRKQLSSSAAKPEFNIFWQEPFMQGKLTFKYLPSYIFEQHDSNLDWEDENSSY